MSITHGSVVAPRLEKACRSVWQSIIFRAKPVFILTTIACLMIGSNPAETLLAGQWERRCQIMLSREGGVKRQYAGLCECADFCILTPFSCTRVPLDLHALPDPPQ